MKRVPDVKKLGDNFQCCPEAGDIGRLKTMQCFGKEGEVH